MRRLTVASGLVGTHTFRFLRPDGIPHPDLCWVFTEGRLDVEVEAFYHLSLDSKLEIDGMVIGTVAEALGAARKEMH